MDIHTDGDDSARWLILLIPFFLVACVLGAAALGGSGAASFHIFPSPQDKAEAQAIEQMAAQATAQALDIQRQQAEIQIREQAAAAEMQIAEEQAMAEKRLQMRRTLYSLGMASSVVLFVLGVGVAGAFAVYWMRYYRSRAAMVERAHALPAVREIYFALPDGARFALLLAESERGTVLIEPVTGSTALLSSPVQVNALRAAVIERYLVANRMAQAAERIAGASKNASPGDWLHHIAGASSPQRVVDGMTAPIVHRNGNGHENTESNNL